MSPLASTLRRSGLLLGLFLATQGRAQGTGIPDEVLDFDRTEAWAMKYFAAVGLMQGDGPPPGLEPGHFALGFELSNIPRLSKAQRTVGFNGTKTENLNKAPILARPLVHYAVTRRWSVTAAYVPPVEVFDHLKTHLAGLSVNYRAYEGERLRVGLRLIGQWTWAQGDFTGAKEIAGDPDPERNPLGVQEPSQDIFTSWTATFEAGLAWRLPTRRETSWFLDTAVTHADLDFEIDAILAGGYRDNRHQVTEGWLWSIGTGVETQLTPTISARLAAVYVPLGVRRPPDYAHRNDALLNLRLVLQKRF